MGSKILVVGILLLTTASVCLLNAPRTSALALTNLVQTLTNPVTTLISRDEGSSSSSEGTKGGSHHSQTAPAPVNSSTSQGSVADNTAPLATSRTNTLEVPANTPTKSQIAPPPATAIPAYSKSAVVINGRPVIASAVSLEDQQVKGAAIERTTQGWRIANLFWYQWLTVVALLICTIVALRYHWKALMNQSILSKK